MKQLENNNRPLHVWITCWPLDKFFPSSFLMNWHNANMQCLAKNLTRTTFLFSVAFNFWKVFVVMMRKKPCGGQSMCENYVHALWTSLSQFESSESWNCNQTQITTLLPLSSYGRHSVWWVDHIICLSPDGPITLEQDKSGLVNPHYPLPLLQGPIFMFPSCSLVGISSDVQWFSYGYTAV